MFAPKLYTVRKYSAKVIIESDNDIKISLEEQKKKYNVREQDNSLFRQIRLITSTSNEYNKYIVFVDCKSYGKNKDEELSNLISNGFTINNQHFSFSERSASMTRNSILSFVDSDIIDELNERVTMGIHVGKTSLAKYYAYRGLMLSSCHCIENWYPKIIVVPDCYRTIKKQNIKFLYDKEVEFVKDGINRVWKQKDIDYGARDIELNLFDGCGIHHPNITIDVQKRLKSETKPTSIQWRAPFLKGMTHEVDYVQFFEDNDIKEITDIWGITHDVTKAAPPMIIVFESMYKGLKYFKKTNTYKDWEFYWEQFRKYQHCLGIARWNFSLEEEPIYTRGNYQILQDLQLGYEDFAPIVKDTIDWIEKIINGDALYTYCFLGMFADRCKPLNNFTKAVLKNPEMMKEEGVRNYFINLVDKKKDDMKCGKLFLYGSFKYLAPDLIMAMQHIGRIDTVGCLNDNEFYSKNINGVIIGEKLIERNPHICHSEHSILVGVDNKLIQKYCSELVNVCMVNSKSLIMPRLNGADTDGDLVLVVDNDIMLSGVDRDSLIVMDIDDKISASDEEDTPENRVAVTLRTMKNLIGEYSNYSSAYHNKTPKTINQKQKYNNYIDTISIMTGKAIDYAKTGVLYPMPRHIAKYGRPLPYFMKYRSDYYKTQRLSRSNSNMNRLCWELEKWDRQIRWKRTFKDFDYHIMIDDFIEIDNNVFSKIEDIFLRFCKDMVQLKRDEIDIRKDNKDFSMHWEYYYNQYREECKKICGDNKMLANIAVVLCYEKYPNKNKKFIWRIAGNGIVENIKQVPIELPLRDNDGEYFYLGKKYSMCSTVFENIREDVSVID